jgi:hypothetical protein
MRVPNDGSLSGAGPTVAEVVAFEDLPFGSLGCRRAVARWSDGSLGEAARWSRDQMAFCEGDLIGKTREQIRALHLRRDRDRLRS